MPNGEFTRQGIQAQPEWLAQVPTDRRFPDARVLLTGCGTSFHAAQTGGEAEQALELVLAPRRDAELLVLLSHEGETPLTLEAARAFPGPKWCVTAVAESPIRSPRAIDERRRIFGSPRYRMKNWPDGWFDP